MKRCLILIVFAFCLFSCEKPSEEGGGGTGSQEFSLLLPGIKTTLSGQTVFWAKGDKVAFYNGTLSAPAVYVSKNSSPASRAAFSCSTDKAEKADNFYECIAPASAFSKWSDNKTAEINLPTSQTVSSGGWDPSAALFAGSGAGTSFSMTSVCSFVKFTIGAASVKAKSVTVKGTEPKSGAASVKFGKGFCNFGEPLSGSKTSASLLCSSAVFPVGTYSIALLPGSKAENIEVEFEDASGKVVYRKSLSGVQLQQGRAVNLGTIPSAEESNLRLVASGTNKVYVIDAGKVKWEEEYTKGLVWSWESSSLGSTFKSADISEAIPVNGGKELFITGAYYNSSQKGWCVHLKPDYSTPNGYQQLFFTTETQNAHSATLLPGGYIVVACSNGDDCLRVFNPSGTTPSQSIGSYPLTSAHGVVWNVNSKRLFAIGGNFLYIYSFNESEGTLKLEKTVTATSYTDHLHSLAEVDANTLVMGGNYAATYDIPTGTFKAVNWFKDSYTKGIKSLNINPMTGEAFYSFASSVTGVGNNNTHTHTIRYTGDVTKQYDHDAEKHIMVNDINMYKVRVLSW